MRIKTLPLALLLFLKTLDTQAANFIENFGSGADAFDLSFTQIGNPGNAADTTGSPNPAGSVAYGYNIGTYEISRDQVTKANKQGALGITIQDMSSIGGNGVNRPATGISWYEAAKFVNWLSTSKGGTAAYKFDGLGNFQLWTTGEAGYNPNNQYRNTLATYFLPSLNEWYKAAYGSPSGTWYNYPTGNDTIPTSVSGGTSGGTAVYNQSAPADVTNAGGLSSYGTMAQGGNAWEWNETAYDLVNNTAGEDINLRGGSWNSNGLLDVSFRLNYNPSLKASDSGFRVASVPEPATGVMVLLGLGALLGLRGRRRAV